jgi:Thiol:disulfide interchange protein
LNRRRRETQGRLDQSRSRDHIFVEGTGPRGVPLYLFWAPGAERPKILPQVLTESLILSELSSIQQAKR